MEGKDILQQLATDISRRALLSRGLNAAGWGAFAAVLGAGTVETVSFFFPRVIFRAPSTFRIGTPDAFRASPEGADKYGVILIDETWKSKQRFFVVRERQRLYAISARCTHLGCTINWFGDLRAFKCPCHGSQFHSNGANFAGPAPRHLDRLHIGLNVDGELVVDTAIIYGRERFDVDGAFVALSA